MNNNIISISFALFLKIYTNKYYWLFYSINKVESIKSYVSMFKNNKIYTYSIASVLLYDIFVRIYGNNNMISKQINNISVLLQYSIYRIGHKFITLYLPSEPEIETDDEDYEESNDKYLFTNRQNSCVICYDIMRNKTFLQFYVNNKLVSSQLWKDGNYIYLENYELNNTLNYNDKQISDITCCISQNIMIHPIILSCGHTIDKFSLIQMQNNLCPLCKNNIDNYETDDVLLNMVKICSFVCDNREIDYMTLKQYHEYVIVNKM
jgi:hypothetical protein